MIEERVRARRTGAHWVLDSLASMHDRGTGHQRHRAIAVGMLERQRHDGPVHGWKLAEAISDLEPGKQITFAIEVADYNPDQDAHRRRSATRQLTIVDPERYLEWYRAELAAQQEELKRSRDSEKVTSGVIKQIQVNAFKRVGSGYAERNKPKACFQVDWNLLSPRP